MSATDAAIPSHNGEHADFRLNASQLEAHPRAAYTSRDGLAADVRIIVKPEWFTDHDDYTAVADAVTDHLDPWLDYERGAWKGTDVTASIVALNHDDFWFIAAAALLERLERYAG